MIFRVIFLFPLLFFSSLSAHSSYKLSLDEISPSLKKEFTEYSSLIKFQEIPLKTNSQLEWRAQDDLELLKRLYQEEGHLSPDLKLGILYDDTPPTIEIKGSSGPLYLLKAVEVNDGIQTYQLQGDEIGQTATIERILHLEDELIKRLKKKGYPFAELDNRSILASKEEASVTVILEVNIGPKATFANVSIKGNKSVETELIRQKITWDPGDSYSAQAVDETASALEATGLFTQVIVKPLSTEYNEVPMMIEVSEAKHRTIGAGVGFTSQLGAGVNLEWEHRNFRRIGETLNIRTSLWNRLQSASILYLKPDVFLEGQNLISKAEVFREVTDGFTELSWGVSSLLERQFSETAQISYGLAFKQLHNTRSDNDRLFTLVKTPFKLYYNKTDDLMDPSMGCTAWLKLTPTLQILSPQFAYCISQLNLTQYVPLNDNCILAGKLSFGSIWGSSRRGIPPSERFYAGTESLLRGYRYMTVSPLNEKHKPIGGRSLLIGSLEIRKKITDTIGLVGFYEAGNVYDTSAPNFKEKILQSAGGGVRYHTPVGPLRCDVGFPLNPRKHVDKGYEIYFSIGQSF